jgi:hypothetical protein
MIPEMGLATMADEVSKQRLGLKGRGIEQQLAVPADFQWTQKV